MSCNCIEQTSNKIKELYPNAEYVSYDNLELLSARVYSTVSIKLPHKKKPEKISLLHSYCPTCGKKYEEDKVSEDE